VVRLSLGNGKLEVSVSTGQLALYVDLPRVGQGRDRIGMGAKGGVTKNGVHPFVLPRISGDAATDAALGEISELETLSRPHLLWSRA